MYLLSPFLETTWKPKHRHVHHLSTAGTTASICIIRKDRMFVANVGDSTVVLGTRSQTHQSTYPATLEALILTKDHKPADSEERKRIQATGGGVSVSRRGETRVLWHKANGISLSMVNVSRSLGDLWSYNKKHDSYHVSPIPDVHEHIISPDHDVFMIMASDGLWNVISPKEAVDFVNSFRQDELENGGEEESELRYSKVADALLEEALREWRRRRWAADNITISIVYFFENGSAKKVNCYFRPSAAVPSDVRRYQKSTKKAAILPSDIQLARRICGKNTLVD